MALPMPGAQQTAKNAASIQRKANVRAVAAQGGANAGTVQKIATEEATTAGQGALEQQKQQVGQAVTQQESVTADQELQQSKDQTKRQADLSKMRDNTKTHLGALKRDANREINDQTREFTMSEARREWTNSDTLRMAAAAEATTADEWQRDQEEMVAAYDDIVKDMNRKTNLKIKKLSRDLAKAEAQKDRDMVMRVKAKMAALERERKRRAKNAKKNGKYLGAAKTVVGAVAMYYSGGIVGGTMVAEGAQEASA